MNKSKKFSIRLTEEQHKIIKRKSGKNSMSMYCRNFLLNEIHGGSSVADELLSVRQELSRIGNNINQIAKHANQSQTIMMNELKNHINDLRHLTNDKLSKVR